MMIEDAKAEEANPLPQEKDVGFVRVQLKRELLVQEGVNLFFIRFQLFHG